MSVQESPGTITNTGPGGCPVLHGFNPMDPEQNAAPAFITEIARREAPVFFYEALGCYMVTRHEDVGYVMSKGKLFVALGLGMSRHEPPEEVAHLLPNGFLSQSAGMQAWGDPDQHARLRRLGQKAFTRGSAAAKAPRITELFDETIDELIDRGSADLIEVYTRHVPMRVMIAILGIDPEMEPKLHQWTNDTMRMMGDPNISREDLVDLTIRASEYENFVRGLIEDRRADPQPEGDLISDLLAARDPEGSPKLTDDEIFFIVALSIVAGGDTTVNLVSQILYRLLDNDRDLWNQVAADPDLLENVIEEELRIGNVGRISIRRATEDTEIAGTPIPAGSMVGVHLWSTGHDATVFPDPEKFDLHRENKDRHLGFGRGVRFCMGSPLALVETRIAVQRIMERIPSLRLAPGAGLEREISIVVPTVKSGLLTEWDV